MTDKLLDDGYSPDSWPCFGEKWDDGVVPFEAHCSLENNELALFAQAMKHIEDKTNIRFVPYNSNMHQNYIILSDIEARSANSSVGKMKVPGWQRVNLDCDGGWQPWKCKYGMGTAVHELMHALGWYHTQSRPDRNSYVFILDENIEEGKEHNFDVATDDDVHEKVQKCRPYNYGSIMHYSEKAFSKNGGKTITTWDSGKQGVIGNRDGLNAQDIEEINSYYFGSKKCTVSKIPVSDTTKVPVGQPIAIKTTHNTYLRAWPGGRSKVDTQTYIGGWENFTIEKVSGQNGVFAFCTNHGTYLRAELGGAGSKVDTQTFIGGWERFTIEEISGENGVFAIRTVHGTYLRAEPGGAGAKVDTQTYIEGWEKFRFEHV